MMSQTLALTLALWAALMTTALAQQAPASPFASSPLATPQAADERAAPLLVLAQGLSARQEAALREGLAELLGVEPISLTDPRVGEAQGSVAVARSARGWVVRVDPGDRPGVAVVLPQRYVAGEPAAAVLRLVWGLWPGAPAPVAGAPRTTGSSSGDSPEACAQCRCPWLSTSDFYTRIDHPDVLDPWAPLPKLPILSWPPRLEELRKATE